MGLASLLLSVVAGVMTILAFLAAFVPIWGAVFAFAAPACALIGIILAGLSMSQAGREGRSKDLSTLAIVFNMLAFFPALMVALTCGLCNALLATAPLDVQRTFSVQMGFPDPTDGGMPQDARGPDGVPEPSSDDTPPHGDRDDLPPPPLPAGPSQER